ncbi:hypothetical protein LINPERPRIM_LOCUS30120 [Linum perenne]
MCLGKLTMQPIILLIWATVSTLTLSFSLLQILFCVIGLDTTFSECLCRKLYLLLIKG